MLTESPYVFEFVIFVILNLINTLFFMNVHINWISPGYFVVFEFVKRLKIKA